MYRPNIFWILTDGTRNKPGRDKFGRYKTLYEFDKDSVRFSTAVSSASATLMSIISILTGRFTSELYPDFLYLHEKGLCYPNYIDILKKAGYAINSTIYVTGAGKTLFKELNVYHGAKEELMTSKETFEEFKYIMEHKFDESSPNFVFAHFGTYDDVDKYVRKTLDYIKKQKLYENSIIILSSDHGYVDYGRFHYFGWALQPRTHSFYVDENTSHANLNMRIPSPLSEIRGKEVNVHIDLFDMFETIFDYLGIKYECDNKKAESLKPLIESDDKKIIDRFNRRILRTESRFQIQNHRKSRIIGNGKVFVVSNEENIKKMPTGFKEFYARTEKEAKNTVFKMIEEAYQKSDISKTKNQKIAIYNYNYKEFIDYLYRRLKANNNIVSVLDLKGIKNDYKKYDMIIAIVNNSEFYMFNRLCAFCKRKNVNFKLLNSMFKEIEYKRYSYLKGALNDPAIKTSKYGFFVNCLLFVMLLLVKFYELRLLNKKRNYHPIIKRL